MNAKLKLLVRFYILISCNFILHKGEGRPTDNTRSNRNSNSTPFEEYFDWSFLDEPDFPSEDRHRIRKRDYNLDGYRKSCKNTFDVWEDKTIKLISPYNGKQQYPGGLDCEFIFVGEPECLPIITCEIIDLRKSNGCSEDRLLITNGITGEKEFCGPHMGFSHPFKSRVGTYLFLTFRTGDSTYFDRLYKGFNCKICCHTSSKANANQVLLPEDGAARKEETSLLCGMKFDEGNQRIVGGEDATRNEFPWLAALVNYNTRKPFCGSSLINNRYILTAAHCVLEDTEDLTSLIKTDSFQVMLRAHILEVTVNLNGTDDDAPGKNIEDKPEDRKDIRLDVEKIMVHRHYNKFDEYDSDLALIKLKVALDLKKMETPTPICLPEPTSVFETYEGKSVTVAGWGHYTENATGTTKLLQKITFPIIPHDKCTEVYHNTIGITGHMICAGNLAGGTDSCQGDSGGPLITPIDTTKQWVQIGVVSMGDGCARENRPGVYVHLAKYMQWILFKTKGSIWPSSKQNNS